MAPDYVAGYFHRRARELADQGDAAAALAQVERGLTYATGAELHLLAAILAQRIERYDQMRHHVAAIAVDDSLRPEAEWLLRAHQARQRALHGQAQAQPSGGAAALLDDLLGRNQRAEAPAGSHPLQALWPALTVMALLGLIAVAYFTFGSRDNSPETAQMSTPSDAAPAAEETAASSPAETAVTPFMEANLLPTPTPTPERLAADSLEERIPEDGTRGADAAVADSGPRPVVIIAAGSFDLAGYLRKNGHPELAELGVDARLQGTTLILRGVVQLDRQRRQLLEVLTAAPGVTEVNSVDLMLLPAPTYVVQEGETLWSIVYDIYGNAERMQDLIDLNRDVMPSPELLSPGLELKVPPVQ